MSKPHAFGDIAKECMVSVLDEGGWSDRALIRRLAELLEQRFPTTRESTSSGDDDGEFYRAILHQTGWARGTVLEEIKKLKDELQRVSSNVDAQIHRAIMGERERCATIAKNLAVASHTYCSEEIQREIRKGITP